MPSETEFVETLVELYREVERVDLSKIQWGFTMRYDVYDSLMKEMQAWEEATKDMTEAEVKIYFESIHGVGSWDLEDGQVSGWGKDSQE